MIRIIDGGRGASEAGAVPQADDGRPVIVVGTDESRVVDEAIAALSRAQGVYVRAGEIVEIVAREEVTRGVTRDGVPVRAHRCAEARVRELLAREARWFAGDGGGGMRPVHPPQWAVRAVMARGTWPGIRPLLAVAEAPTIRPDGTLLATPGYDAATGIYLASDVRVTVPEAPTREDAQRAVMTLMAPVADFPLAGAAHGAAWLAGLLGVVARPIVDGPIPLVLVDATTRAAGKGLLVDVASVIATGRRAARMVYSRDDAEVRKVITALALAGDPLVLLDNVAVELGCASLDAALTATTWRDRVLGASELTCEIPLRVAWWATGNGVVVGADMARRVLLVRLEPACEHPEERTGWRYPRLLDHVREHRAELLSAALTIVRAYVVAGRPDMRLTPMGSYESWSDTIRSALTWLRVPDPCATIADVRQMDARADALRAVVAAWPVPDGRPATAAELIELAAPGSEWRAALTEWCGTAAGELPSARTLGYRLRSVRGRIVAGWRIDLARTDRDGRALWRRTRVGGTP